jgi:hypothetical protein
MCQAKDIWMKGGPLSTHENSQFRKTDLSSQWRFLANKRPHSLFSSNDYGPTTVATATGLPILAFAIFWIEYISPIVTSIAAATMYPSRS